MYLPSNRGVATLARKSAPSEGLNRSCRGNIRARTHRPGLLVTTGCPAVILFGARRWERHCAIARLAAVVRRLRRRSPWSAPCWHRSASILCDRRLGTTTRTAAAGLQLRHPCGVASRVRVICVGPRSDRRTQRSVEVFLSTFTRPAPLGASPEPGAGARAVRGGRAGRPD